MKIFLVTFLLFLCFLCSANYKDINQIAIQDVLPWMDAKIAQAKVEENPFPHIVVNDIFPPHYYSQIQSFWPKSSEFVGSIRAIIPCTGGCLEDTNLSTEEKMFWQTFGEVVVNRYMKPRLIEKLKAYVQMKLHLQKMQPQDLNMMSFTNLRQDCLIEDARDFSIPPHIDQLNLFAAILLYLPNDNDHQQFGTTFLKGDPNSSPSTTDIYHNNPSQLTKIKMVPYKKNTLVCFLQCPVGWHSVEAQQLPRPYVRKLYVAPIFWSPEFMQTHYSGIYNRSSLDEYFFDHRFLSKGNWTNIWQITDTYR